MRDKTNKKILKQKKKQIKIVGNIFLKLQKNLQFLVYKTFFFT